MTATATHRDRRADFQVRFAATVTAPPVTAGLGGAPGGGHCRATRPRWSFRAPQWRCEPSHSR